MTDLSLSGHHYLEFDEYNEQHIQAGIGYAHKNQTTNWRIKPFMLIIVSMTKVAMMITELIWV